MPEMEKRIAQRVIHNLAAVVSATRKPISDTSLVSSSFRGTRMGLHPYAFAGGCVCRVTKSLPLSFYTRAPFNLLYFHYYGNFSTLHTAVAEGNCSLRRSRSHFNSLESGVVGGEIGT